MKSTIDFLATSQPALGFYQKFVEITTKSFSDDICETFPISDLWLNISLITKPSLYQLPLRRHHTIPHIASSTCYNIQSELSVSKLLSVIRSTSLVHFKNFWDMTSLTWIPSLHTFVALLYMLICHMSLLGLGSAGYISGIEKTFCPGSFSLCMSLLVYESNFFHGGCVNSLHHTYIF